VRWLCRRGGLSGAWFGRFLTWFAERYDRLAIYRQDVIIPFGFASMAVQSVISAWAYPRLFTRRHDWMTEALHCFVVLGLLSWSFTTLPVAAKFRMASVSELRPSSSP
jgi:hypothetical protein